MRISYIEHARDRLVTTQAHRCSVATGVDAHKAVPLFRQNPFHRVDQDQTLAPAPHTTIALQYLKHSCGIFSHYNE